jgi:hypothetical protein
MKKLCVIGLLAALALIVFGAVGYAYAQSQNPGSPNGAAGYGCGMYGASNGQQATGGRAGRRRMGNGMMGYGANNQANFSCPMADGDEDGTVEYGPMHDDMYQAFAQALGITPAELETRLRAGDTLWAIAQEQGLTADQFQEAMAAARISAVNQAVADGILTQAQADFMLQHMGSRMGNGFGPGFGGCFNYQGVQNNQP